MGEQVSFLDRVQENLMKVTGKIQSNNYVTAVTHGMVGSLSILIGGSVLNLLVNLPIPGWSDLLTSIGIYEVLTAVVKIFQLTAVIMCFNVAYALAKFKGVDRLQSGIISIMCLLITIPISTTGSGAEAFELTFLNAQGVFTAMITGLLATTIFAFIIHKKIVFRMPESVPEYVRNTFNIVPPAFLTVIPFIILRGILEHTSFGTFPGLVNSIITLPLQALGNNLIGHMVFLAASSILWWFGVHNMPIMVSAYILTLPAMTENINAAMSGQAPIHMLSWETFKITGQYLGGPGCLIGLFICMLLFTKSERYKVQSKLQFIPGLFNITEPANFGIPIVLNPTLLIPFVLVPQIIEVALYFCLKAGLFTTPVVMLTDYIPGPIGGFLFGSGLGAGFFMIAASIFSIICYYPFVKMMDKVALKEETA
ncbi:PTS transporter subunit EIIC [Paenibacillus sp. DMB5]|uniref:PTS sugar transporter subunit IIC n=1 Tax=Paenibacillus sp. DMB5 TaxID=1780103 RepID=UPI00076D8B60|nr:PTS transporter subunit EIIC [Paenibacillus sp. DMB5]KUP25913.1 hypothetical protein AWJ19_33390 [Paenibacillus sp. DMB5]